MKPKQPNQKREFVVEIIYSPTPDATRRLEKVFHLLLSKAKEKEAGTVSKGVIDE